MIGSRRWLFGMLSLMCLTGASCPRQMVPVGPIAPVVFEAQPSVEQIIQVVNQNTQRIRQLEANGATLNVAGAPSLRTSLAIERPLRFRLQARTGLTGNELDVGSNDEYFWFWARRAQPAAVYYASHAQATDPRVQRVMPIPPHWIMEAMGLVWLDPNRAYDGPYVRGPNQLELRYVEATPNGPVTKLLVIDAQRGQINQLAIYNASNQLIAAATASNFQYDTAMLAWLPRQVDVQLPESQMSLSLSVENYTINQLTGSPTQLWAMPNISGAPPMNLAETAR